MRTSVDTDVMSSLSSQGLLLLMSSRGDPILYTVDGCEILHEILHQWDSLHRTPMVESQKISHPQGWSEVKRPSGNQTWRAGKYTSYRYLVRWFHPIETPISFVDFPACHVWWPEGVWFHLGARCLLHPLVTEDCSVVAGGFFIAIYFIPWLQELFHSIKC